MCHRYSSRLCMVILLVIGLVLTPVVPRIASAAEGPAAAGSDEVKQPAGTATGAAGVGVSGAPSKPAPSGKGVLAPPKEGAPPVKSAETKEVPKGIGASAGTVGTAAAKTGGVSAGWKIGAAVLGLGALLGLAGGGGGGGSTSNH